jgi:hypothetical protein
MYPSYSGKAGNLVLAAKNAKANMKRIASGAAFALSGF